VFLELSGISAPDIYISRGENLYAVATQNGLRTIIYMSSPSQKRHKSESTSEECPVCMEDMTKDKIAKTFLCGKHKTCGQCYADIMTSKKQNRACPLCRTEEQLITDKEFRQQFYKYRRHISDTEWSKLLDTIKEHKSLLNPEDIPKQMYRDLPPSLSPDYTEPSYENLTRLAQLQSKGTLGKRKSRKGGQKKRGTKKRR